MALTTREIYQVISAVQCERHQPSALAILHMLLLKSLSPGQKKFYDLILEKDVVTSHTCVERFGCASNYAGNVLRSLHDLGLLKRGWEDSNRHTRTYEVLEDHLHYGELEEDL